MSSCVEKHSHGNIMKNIVLGSQRLHTMTPIFKGLFFFVLFFFWTNMQNLLYLKKKKKKEKKMVISHVEPINTSIKKSNKKV